MTPWQKQFDPGDFYEYWNPCTTKGVSGTAILSKHKAMSMVLDMGVDFGGDDGRIIALEYSDFYLVTAYVPTGTGGKKSEAIQKKLVWLSDFVEYVKTLNQKKPVILCGDMNIAHNEIDLSYPDHKSAGFTDKEPSARKLQGGVNLTSFHCNNLH